MQNEFSTVKNFTLLIKPTSADCNLRCQYCFYLEKRKLYPSTQTHRITDSVLERLISSYLSSNQTIYTFCWQGGEPTLMGSNFFKLITDLQKKYARPGAQVANALQTNATFINDAMAEHLARYNFLVGCSLDGPPEIHNRYREYPSGKPTYHAVIKGIESLHSKGVEFNILVLVSKANVNQARLVYRYLVNKGYHFHQYIPCVEFGKDGKALPYSINSHEWGKFLCELFDAWYPRDVYKVSVRNFDAILNKRLDNIDSTCSLANDCCQYFVVEYNGDIYPCDFFVEKDLLIGNIADITWEEALSSKLYRDFGGRKAELNQQCLDCAFLDLCMGDCQKHRRKIGTQTPVVSYLCQGWRQFFKHTEHALESLIKTIQFNRLKDQLGSQQAFHTVKKSTPGRNQPCPCGSGKKFKKCCCS
jgi:uncharacterized protein